MRREAHVRFLGGRSPRGEPLPAGSTLDIGDSHFVDLLSLFKGPYMENCEETKASVAFLNADGGKRLTLAQIQFLTIVGNMMALKWRHEHGALNLNAPAAKVEPIHRKY